MNERIRLLAEQAFFDDASSQPSDRVYTFSDHKMQKFAELIVGECMSVADLPKNPSGQWDHLESSEVIAKHFGVES
jgi:hypothetical protein